MKTVLIILIAMCSLAFFCGCEEENSLAPKETDDTNQSVLMLAPSYCIYWPWASEAAKNEAIINEARGCLKRNEYYPPCNDRNDPYGQCKWWVKEIVVLKASQEIVYLPPNYLKQDGWYGAKWFGSKHARIVWQGCYYCPSQFPTNILRMGHIIQFRARNGVYHTAIIESVNSTGMTWIDCNFRWDCRVRRHDYSLWEWQKNVVAWTVYQII